MSFDTLLYDLDDKTISFAAKLFGSISEDVVRFWLKNPNCQDFEYLGIPNIYKSDNPKSIARLDFTFRDKRTNKCYIVEQKNLIAFSKGRLRTLNENNYRAFLKWSATKSRQTFAWKLFINPLLPEYKVFANKIEIPNPGKILIWPHFDSYGQDRLLADKEFDIDILLSFEKICRDLIIWEDKNYQEIFSKYEEVSKQIFLYLRTK